MEQQRKLYEQGQILMKYNRYDDALSRFECALEYATTDAASAETWYRIGCCRSEIAKQKIEGAEERLCAYEEFELYERAIEAYQKAIELQPDYTSARRFLAELFTYFGEMQSEADKDDLFDWLQVIKWYKQAIEVYPGLTDSYYKLAQAYTFLMDDKSINNWEMTIYSAKQT